MTIDIEMCEQALPSCDVQPIVIDEVEIGFMVSRGHEVHLKIDQAYALKHARRIIKQYIKPHLDALGYLTTIATGERQTLRFLDRLGFYKVGGFGSMTMHRLDALKIQ